MPSLRAFGRRWNIASDDFVFPEITEALVRISWVLITCGIFILHNPFHCSSLLWFIFVIILVIINLFSVILCICLAIISARGSILEVGARKYVTTLIYLRVPLLLAEFIWTIISTCYVFRVFGEADFCYFIYGMRITVILEWILIIALFISVLIFFNPYGNHRHESVTVERNYWRSRLRLCKVGQDSEIRKAIDDIASLMASFFVGHDFVGSDIVAGMLLLVHSPHEVKSFENIESLRPSMPEWMKLPENLASIERFFTFAVAVYGWPSYMINNCGCMPWYRLISKLQFCSSCRCDRVLVVDDNCCSCHTSAFVIESELNETDLFYISFRNRLYQTPFVVLADHQTKNIVITIRGSASLLDLITDLSLNNERFSVDVDSDPILREDHTLDDGEVRVHRGMLNGARYVYNTIKGQKILDDLFLLNPDYGLVICGHSLGAGVASLLTLLLKQQYPNVRCYAFSPPGCVISKHGLQEMENHVLSIIVGDDLVPRISYQSMCRLKNKIDREIRSTTRAKYEILIKGIFKLFFAAPWELHNQNNIDVEARDCRRLIVNENSINYGASNGGRQEESSLVIEDDQEGAVITDSFKVQLFPPGRLAHFNIVNDKVQLRWIEPSFLSEIQLTGAIFSDHFPYRLRKVFKKALYENGLILTQETTSSEQ